jgi:hypothetical protein
VSRKHRHYALEIEPYFKQFFDRSPTHADVKEAVLKRINKLKKIRQQQLLEEQERVDLFRKLLQPFLVA